MKLSLLVCLILGLVPATQALAEVSASLSRDTIARNESVQLRLEADGTSGAPDLAPLQQDFNIVQRSVSRSTRSFNGRTTQISTLVLTLVPLRSGDLKVPAIAFGTERSRPLTLTVLPAAEGSNTPAATAPPAANGFSPGFPAPSQSWLAPQGGFAPPMWGVPGFGPPDWQTPGDAQGWRSQPVPAREPAAEPAAAAQPEPLFWPWILLAAVVGGVVTSVTVCYLRSRRMQRRRRPAAPAKPVVEPEPAPLPTPAPVPQPPVRHEDWPARIRDAYESKDPFAAKEALLHWAAERWPDDPPGNLSRLAARCQESLQRQLLKLDEALYSPTPVEWTGKPVWDMLDRPNPRAAEVAVDQRTEPAPP